MNTMNMPGFTAEASLYRTNDALPSSDNWLRFVNPNSAPDSAGPMYQSRLLL